MKLESPSIDPKTAAPQPPVPPGGLLYKNGALFLSKEFTMDTVPPLIGQIMEYNLMPEEERPDRISLHLNTPGGRVDVCLQLIDAMWSSEIPVDTYAHGMVASCGCITLMAGAKRYASNTAQIMSHVYSTGFRGQETDIPSFVKRSGMMTKTIERHYQACTGLSLKDVRTKLLNGKDEFMTAQEARRLGIIDKVQTVQRPCA